MRILAIETSCDETSIAVVLCTGTLTRPKFEVLENHVSSQIVVHAPFGGVVPRLAKREHLKNLPKVFETVQRKFKNLKVDAVAVTVGPGLAPALWTGVEFAKVLAKDLGVPLLGANHMEGHLFSPFLAATPSNKLFPAVALVVSGGHTILVALSSFSKWKKLGETRDDAAGEAFDKGARLLGLPYPGGPEISKLALSGDSDVVAFPQPMRDQKNYDFSFSGLKTSLLYYLRDHVKVCKADVAASFERAITDVLTHKTLRAAREYRAKSLWLSGGVAANQQLRKKLSAAAGELGVPFLSPAPDYNTDNAAMIAAAAYIGHLRKKSLKIEAQPNLTL
jgi:N6-L-threonylcarbamoyladenine synthase